MTDKWSRPQKPTPRQLPRSTRLYHVLKEVRRAREEGMASLFDEEQAFAAWAEATHLRYLREDADGGR